MTVERGAGSEFASACPAKDFVRQKQRLANDAELREARKHVKATMPPPIKLVSVITLSNVKGTYS